MRGKVNHAGTCERAVRRAGMSSLFKGRLANVALLRAQDPLPETSDELCAVANMLGATESQVFLGQRANCAVFGFSQPARPNLRSVPVRFVARDRPGKGLPSIASFFCRRTNGFTYAGGISRTSWPS